MILNVEVFLTFTLAIAFLFVGKILTMRSALLRERSLERVGTKTVPTLQSF